MNNNRASSMMIIRLVICAYLIYLGGSLIHDQQSGVSTIAPWLSWISGILFIAAGLLYGWFSWKRYRGDTADRQKKQEEKKNKGRSLVRGFSLFVVEDIYLCLLSSMMVTGPSFMRDTFICAPNSPCSV